MSRWFSFVVTLFLLNSTPNAAAQEVVTIYRDEFGIPNVFAPTDDGAAYGMGYAQAEDRLEQLLRQYRTAEGTMAEVFGPGHLKDDYQARLWQHRQMAEQNYPKLPPHVRSLIEAYQQGIKAFMKEHPEKVPPWAPEIHPWHVVALSRIIIWPWPLGDGRRDLENAGIRQDPVPYRGSNQWIVAPNRTVDGHAIALIDPHLSWYGAFRFYEARLYGKTLQTAGVAIPGLPLSSLGHNRYCSVAMTTGGPDCADVYEEELHPKDPLQYKYDDKWRTMTVRKETIKIKKGDKVESQTFDMTYTHHGPIVARANGHAYAMKIAYFNEFRLPEQGQLMATAKNLEEMKKALSLFQLMEQNIMVSTVKGDVYYLRNGRVPIRPKGYDWTKPVPGNTSKTEWLGIHKLEDLIQVENPWQGYVQNCNVSPTFLMKHSPITVEKYKDRDYLLNGLFPLHQRAAMTLDQLHQETRMSIAKAKDIALSTEVHSADLWQARLVNARNKSDKALSKDAQELYELITRWNRRADSNSVGALAFYYWKLETGEFVLYDNTMLTALETAARKMKKDWGRLEVQFGEMFRVGRTGSTKTWPVGGGSLNGMATPRAIRFRRMADGKRWVGRSGQTSVQVVQMSDPPKSWTMLPLGESDDPKSPHFDDQAEKLFGPGKMKSTYFLDKEELLKHVTRKTVLQRPLE